MLRARLIKCGTCSRHRIMLQANKNETCNPEDYVKPPSKNQKDLEVQLILSLILGISALIAFCILRPRWPALYSARKRRLDADTAPPTLSNSSFGWIPHLLRVTDEQVLASAGLDAFVFLAFFKMAIRLFMTMAFFAVVVLWPINSHYRDFQLGIGDGHGNGSSSTAYHDLYGPIRRPLYGQSFALDALPGSGEDKSRVRTYLWAYVVFTYFFVGLTLYFINRETFRIIGLRQKYLGSQSTITDRTFRLTGIPLEYRSEEKLKEMIEGLGIGLVDSVTLCRNWRKLDALVAYRDKILRQLEAAWAKYLKQQQNVTKQHSDSTQTHSASLANDAQEPDSSSRLLASNPNQPHVIEGERPWINIWYGPLSLRRRRVDAMDYYEERLRRLDERVAEARNEDYEATDMALVTMDTVASCQMVVQARIDPRPGCFLTKLSPSPSDLVWKNTYSPRGIRRLKSWGITLFITVLTLLWIFPTAILASWLSVCTIKTVLPSFSKWLTHHPIIYSLFQNGLPTLVVSLLNVAVPYLYDWLSNHQGMMSQGDVELSVISKNFFFTFFNTFFVFAVSRTGFDFWSVLQQLLKDTSKIPAAIAADVEDLSIFYINFIMLQGVGLMPFRILEVGSVFLYPIYRFMSSTPRDFAELQKPPVFQYGFYLPTALLVFNLCVIYSVLMWGFAILVFGTVYFILGHLTFKYMVLYAMDQPQHATGGAWRIICLRIIIGLVVFEVVMIGQIASLSAFVQSVAVLPLIPFTIWYSYYFKRRFEPLTKYIALRAIGCGQSTEDGSGADDESQPLRGLVRRRSTLDEYREKDLIFVNPSLVTPLPEPWIDKDPPQPESPGDRPAAEADRPRQTLILPDADRSLGIGDDNVWADSNRAERRQQRFTVANLPTCLFLTRSIEAGAALHDDDDSRFIDRAKTIWPNLILPTNLSIIPQSYPWPRLSHPLPSGLIFFFFITRFTVTLSAKTSSQILVSRGVAGTRAKRRPSQRPALTNRSLAVVAPVSGDVEPPWGAKMRDDGDRTGRPSSMRLPTELLQHIFFFLSPIDFNSARHTCRAWFIASLHHLLLIEMLRKGGCMAGPPTQSSEHVMSKWISRECNLADPNGRAFVERGLSDFGDMVHRPSSSAVAFTVSLCGRYLLATHGQVAYLYELNHVCPPGRSSWARPLRRRQGMPLGFLRPVTTVVCPRRIIACSMDTSAGRYAVAFLMDGRMGMRSIYRNICHPDDPPRSVAICPQRNCVAFGCGAGIELHWVDALAGQDLSRWFPLSSPCDFLHFLPPRRGLDTAKRLRLISSAAALGDFSGSSIGDILHGLSTSLFGTASTAVVSLVGTTETRSPPGEAYPRQRFLSTDHYRAVPLSDGYHILFTDPRTGHLCLGTDAPVGSLTRLLRKVWFRPPLGAISPAPVLYAAGADLRHGVRVVAAYAASTAAEQPDDQMVVFYSLPPDVFHDMSTTAPATADQTRASSGRPRSALSTWQPHFQPMNLFGESRSDYPIDIIGQPVATCRRLTQLALKSSPDMVIWAFSADGWAKTWAVETGNAEPYVRTAVLRDGSVRRVDGDGDVVMADDCEWLGGAPAFDGAAGNSPLEADPPGSSPGSYFAPTGPRRGDRMSGTVSVDLVEDVRGIVRLDVELR
ncbi:hypothetical protein L249_2829 [Ophiocordyceps polyrhachis-furcata BCC 54312]|uniref:F-box domain-containing protein n=1 Tax=Ophiocordyceps polyrhachis-furcata BCC 54312 TaxID=1330021 RepID=A0A367LMZ3_9HYPO|nr:hypothetical protein L249_2829 [Ophiocordyceps polyrhachis-furcata BCC 54312]